MTKEKKVKHIYFEWLLGGSILLKKSFWNIVFEDIGRSFNNRKCCLSKRVLFSLHEKLCAIHEGGILILRGCTTIEQEVMRVPRHLWDSNPWLILYRSIVGVYSLLRDWINIPENDISKIYFKRTDPLNNGN